MRILFAAIVCLLLIPSHSEANSMIAMEFLNSNLTFGTVNPSQSGYDLSMFNVDGHDTGWDSWLSGYEAFTGPLVAQTLDYNLHGDVIGSEYLYRGGTFTFEFALQRGTETRIGHLIAPILALTILAGEGQDESADAWYQLGPGLLDQTIADALHVGRGILGAEVYSGLILTGHGNRGGVAGNHLTAERQAEDGYADVYITVPEPPGLLLLLVGISVGLACRRYRTVRAA
jgi:hypothetical protein